MNSFSNIKGTLNEVSHLTNQGLKAISKGAEELNLYLEDASMRFKLKQPLKAILAGLERIDNYKNMIKENKSKNSDFVKDALEIVNFDMNDHIIKETIEIKRNAVEYFGIDVQNYSLDQIREITETAIQIIDKQNSDN